MAATMTNAVTAIQDPMGLVCADATRDANCTLVAASGTGNATGLVAVSGTGTSGNNPGFEIKAGILTISHFGGLVAVSGTGDTNAWNGLAVSGAGDSRGAVGISGEGTSSGVASASIVGNSYGSDGAVAVYGNSGADKLAVSGVGDSRAWTLAASGVGDSSAAVAAVSLTGAADGHNFGLSPCHHVSYACLSNPVWTVPASLRCSTSTEREVHFCDHGPASAYVLAASGTGDASSFVAASGTGNARGLVAVSGTSHAAGDAAISLTGNADGGSYVAVSPFGNATGETLAVSLTGSCNGKPCNDVSADACAPFVSCLASLSTIRSVDCGNVCASASLAGDASGGVVAASGMGEAECARHIPCAAVGGERGSGSILGVSPTGPASGLVAGSGTGPASGGVAVSGMNDVHGVLAASGTGSAAGRAAASGTGPASGLVAVSGTGHANGGSECVYLCAPVGAGASGTGNATGAVSAAGTGSASGDWVGISGTGPASGVVAVSGTGPASGGLAVSGCDLAGACGFPPSTPTPSRVDVCQNLLLGHMCHASIGLTESASCGPRCVASASLAGDASGGLVSVAGGGMAACHAFVVIPCVAIGTEGAYGTYAITQNGSATCYVTYVFAGACASIWGWASGPVAFGGTGASGGFLGIALDGSASCAEGVCVAASPTGDAHAPGHGYAAGVSGTGNATGFVAASGAGHASCIAAEHAIRGPACVAVSGGTAHGGTTHGSALAVALFGAASCEGAHPCVALSGMGPATGDVAVSGCESAGLC